MFYLTTHSTHFNTVIWRPTYGKDHSVSEEETLFSISCKGSFIMNQDSTYHGLSYTSRGALAGTRLIY